MKCEAPLALDIGGANLKAAHRNGGAWSVPFALWKDPARLAERLREVAALAPPFDRLLVTMTGELCDCFESKRQGVHHILDAAEALAAGRPIGVWTVHGGPVDVAAARADPLRVAAANWFALASYVATLVPDRRAMLLDMGSTTTDLVALDAGRARPRGLTDMERLASGELLYTGALRTPLMSLGPVVCFRGREHAVMAEHFATTADVYVLTGHSPERPGCTDTADGRPLTRRHAAARVARLIGADLDMISLEEARELAEGFRRNQWQRLGHAIHQARRGHGAELFICSGSGEGIIAAAARAVLPLTCELVSLSGRLGREASVAACAHAMLRLEGLEP